jgi:hypothetical protein
LSGRHQEQLQVPKLKLTLRLVLCLFVAACGNDNEPTAESGDASTMPPQRQTQQTVRTAPDAESVSEECGKGGTECPAGLECVTFRDGVQACGPMAVAAAVLIKDGTLGGRCTFASAADTLPGASIASVQIIGTDGNVKGYGRLVWEQAGFEVAAERGTPPDGTAPAGDACTDSFNLGCDGQAVFEIIGNEGEVQKLREAEMVVVHLRGQESCGEEVADEVEAAICNDPATAAAGNLASCTSKVRMVEARSDIYGPDRVGGTIQYLSGQ